jgi:hypothetical protein
MMFRTVRLFFGIIIFCFQNVKEREKHDFLMISENVIFSFLVEYIMFFDVSK